MRHIKAAALLLSLVLVISISTHYVLAADAADAMDESPTAGSNPANLPNQTTEETNKETDSNVSEPDPFVPAVDTSDKTASSWAAEDVDWMVSNGIVPPQLQFSYKTHITREEFAALAVSVLSFMSESKINFVHTIPENKFEDTDDSDVYRAYAFGIVNGVGDTEFKPKNKITRQEAAMMMSNLLQSVQAKHLSKDDYNYPDRLSIADWAQDAVDITSNVKLFQGTDLGFRPQDSYTREQAIAVMRRLLNFEGSAHMISLRGHVVMHISDLGTAEDAKANKARPVAALVGTKSVKFVWTESNQSANAYLNRFKDESGHHHDNAVQFSPASIAKLESGEPAVKDGDYTIELGKGNQKEGYLLKITW